MLPSPLTLLATVVVAFFVVLVVVRGPIDADYWWHLTTGKLIVESGSVPTTDPYSFSYDGPWVAHEWLGEVLIYGLVSSIGFPATAVLFGLATAGALLIPAAAVHRRGVGVPALIPFVGIGTYTLASFATVRPQVLSWLLLGILIALLLTVRNDHRFRPWLVPPLFVLWANLHGLWPVGLGVVGIYAAFTVFRRTPLAPRSAAAVGMVVASTVGVVLTPAGPAGLLYPLRYLRQDDWGTSFIAEWQSADPTDPRQWGLVAIIIAGLLLGRRGSQGWVAAVAIAGMLGGIVAARNQPLTAIMTLPMLATAIQARMPPPESTPSDAAPVHRQRRVLESAMAVSVIVSIVAILPGVASGTVDDAYPTSALDRLVEERPSARALVDYDWGGYAIHRLHPTDGTVFIDGRSDMYPRPIFADYLTLRAADDGWEALLRRYGVDAILLPPEAPLVGAASAVGFCEAERNAQAVLLLPCTT